MAKKLKKRVSAPKTDDRFAVGAELFPQAGISRSQKRMLEIVQGAIRCYAKHGVEGSDFRTIARESKASYTLVRHYFADSDALFEMVTRFIRLTMQRFVVEQVKQAGTAREQLESYVRTTLAWRIQYPNESKVWVLVWFRCTRDDKYRALNTEFQELGRARIAALLSAISAEEGRGKSASAKNQHAVQQQAALIQALINGGLVLLGTEKFADESQFANQIVKTCLTLTI